MAPDERSTASSRVGESSAGEGPLLAVVGIGNLLLTDEGLGIHAARALCQETQWDGQVVVIDGGTDPWSALAAAEGCRALLVLDAVQGPKEPGETYRLSLEEIETLDTVLSLHGISLLHLLQFESLIGNGFEEVRVLGMQPHSVGPGLGLSDLCRDRLPEFVDAIRAEIGGALTRLAVH